MNFNKYSLYSVLSETEGQQKDDTKKLLDLSSNLEQLNNVAEVKNFVKTRFNITNPITNFSIGKNAYMNIKENQGFYSVNLIFNNKKTYTYKK